MYQWFVFVHLVGVFGFLLAHGVSVGVSFRLRTERNIERVNALLELSSQAITPFWISLMVLLVGGITATFLGDLWGAAWIWAAIATLVVVTVLMFILATSYFRRVRFIARAVSEGTDAVTPEQFDEVLRSRRPITIAVVGFIGLAFILYLMLFKPTFGLGAQAAGAAAPPLESDVEIAADEVAFDTDELDVPAGEPFTIGFDNRGQGVPHNVAIYEDASASEALFVGDVVTGPDVVRYAVPALPEGDYFFRCDVHPTTMTGTVETD